MTTQKSTTGWTSPFFLLLIKKGSHSFFLNVLKIFYKTCFEQRSISRIKVLEMLTGEIAAFVTEFDRMMKQACAPLF